MNGSIRKRGRFTLLAMGIFGLTLSGLTLLRTENSPFPGLTSVRGDETAAETVLPEENFTLEGTDAAEAPPAEDV